MEYLSTKRALQRGCNRIIRPHGFMGEGGAQAEETWLQAPVPSPRTVRGQRSDLTPRGQRLLSSKMGSTPYVATSQD